MAIKHARIKKKSRVWIRLAVVLGVAAMLGLVFVASVGVGKLLLNAAKQYPADQQQEQVSVPEQEIVPVRVPRLKAHSYVIGARYSSYLYSGITQLCAPLRNADGSLNFQSRAAAEVGWDQNGKVDLTTNAWELHRDGLYLCTYIPITGFAIEDAVLRELTLSYEAALIAEAAQSGVDEIFLTGFVPTSANVSEVAAYLERVKLLCGESCAVGILIDPEVFLAAEYDVYLAAMLRNSCDFLVMDLRNLPLDVMESPTDSESGSAPGQTEEQSTQETTGQAPGRQLSVGYVLDQMQYDLTRYSPRLALTESQTDALDAITAKGYHNWLIMGNE